MLYIDESPASFLRVRPLLSGYGAPAPVSPRARHVLAALPLDQCQKDIKTGNLTHESATSSCMG